MGKKQRIRFSRCSFLFRKIEWPKINHHLRLHSLSWLSPSSRNKNVLFQKLLLCSLDYIWNGWCCPYLMRNNSFGKHKLIRCQARTDIPKLQYTLQSINNWLGTIKSYYKSRQRHFCKRKTIVKGLTTPPPKWFPSHSRNQNRKLSFQPNRKSH